jgi:hypothetical protein
MSSINGQSFGVRFKTGLVISVLFLFLIMQGCSDLHNLVWNKADAFIDGHHVVISPCRNSYTKTISDTPTNRDHIFGCGDAIKVQIKNEELTVNDKAYGVLGRGDTIIVKNDKVFINKKEVEALAMK